MCAIYCKNKPTNKQNLPNFQVKFPWHSQFHPNFHLFHCSSTLKSTRFCTVQATTQTKNEFICLTISPFRAHVVAQLAVGFNGKGQWLVDSSLFLNILDSPGSQAETENKRRQPTKAFGVTREVALSTRALCMYHHDWTGNTIRPHYCGIDEFGRKWNRAPCPLFSDQGKIIYICPDGDTDTVWKVGSGGTQGSLKSEIEHPKAEHHSIVCLP